MGISSPLFTLKILYVKSVVESRMGMLSEFKIKKVVSELAKDMETIEIMKKQIIKILEDDLDVLSHAIGDEDKVDLISEVVRGIFSLRKHVYAKMTARLNGQPIPKEEPKLMNRTPISDNIRIIKNWMCDFGQTLKRIESALVLLLEEKKNK